LEKNTHLLDLNAEDAFRIIDIDFDGKISKKDLTSFLKDVLKIPSTEITTSRIGRLFKLMDIFKRNSIQLSEFKKLIYEDLNNSTITRETQSQGFSNFNWKLHGRQQIGLVLSKQFDNLRQSFEGMI